MTRYYKAYIGIKDPTGRIVDHYRMDWKRFDSHIQALHTALREAREFTWGDNNECSPTLRDFVVETADGDVWTTRTLWMCNSCGQEYNDRGTCEECGAPVEIATSIAMS